MDCQATDAKQWLSLIFTGSLELGENFATRLLATCRVPVRGADTYLTGLRLGLSKQEARYLLAPWTTQLCITSRGFKPALNAAIHGMFRIAANEPNGSGGFPAHILLNRRRG